MWLACSRKQLYEKDNYEYLFKSSEKYQGVEVGSQMTPQHRRNPSSHDDMLQSPYLEVGRPEEPLKSKAANLPRAHKTIRWRLPPENVAFESIGQTWTKVSWALCLREMTQGKTVHLYQVFKATEASLPLCADFAAVTSHWSIYCILPSCDFFLPTLVLPHQDRAKTKVRYFTLPCCPSSAIKFQSLIIKIRIYIYIQSIYIYIYTYISALLTRTTQAPSVHTPNSTQIWLMTSSPHPANYQARSLSPKSVHVAPDSPRLVTNRKREPTSQRCFLEETNSTVKG